MFVVDYEAIGDPTDGVRVFLDSATYYEYHLCELFHKFRSSCPGELLLLNKHFIVITFRPKLPRLRLFASRE